MNGRSPYGCDLSLFSPNRPMRHGRNPMDRAYWKLVYLLVFLDVSLQILCVAFRTTVQHIPGANRLYVQETIATIPPTRSVTSLFLSEPIIDSTEAYRSNLPFTNTIAESSDSPEQDYLQYARQTFQPYFPFPLDVWQLEAGAAILQGHNVIVCAPTGAGKTVVGEIALWFAYQASEEGKGIYTTPLKALSNQKYYEFCQTFGRSNTGISTGDVSINKGARITVMTTEVYRNMAWRSSAPDGHDELSQNAVVVLDEFHYMGHPRRGGVWEECIITSPSEQTQIVGLSATLANAPALAAWMESVTKRRTALIDVPAAKRPVPLRYLFATKDGLFPLFRDPDAGPGAPKGLLGYRGDGERPDSQPKQSKISFSRTGFGSIPPTPSVRTSKEEKLPRGLQVNPALVAAAQKRLARVQKSLERQKVKWRVEANQSRQRRGDPENNEEEWMLRQPKKQMSPREERKEKERLLRNEMRRSVPSLHSLVLRLKQRNLLPAIFFLFSRAGCDKAAASLCQNMKGIDSDRVLMDDFDTSGNNGRGSQQSRPQQNDSRQASERKTRSRSAKKQSARLLEDAEGRAFRRESEYLSETTLSSIYNTRILDDQDFDEQSPLSPINWEFYSKAGLLTLDQIREVASRIAIFNEENEEIAFDDDTIEQFVFGVGSHHAGMLPAHKSFVELLYQNQLMLVVVATETLAAGINMPARTTVILSMAKRGDGSSMNLLETSNLLQMAGRAGRRGMDTDGTCVLVATPFETHDDAAKMLTDPIEPITSQFSPSYSLAVNLVARGEGKLDVARQLIGQSFAMWEKRQVEAAVANSVNDTDNEIVLLSAQEAFITKLVETIQYYLDRKTAKYDNSKLSSIVDLLSDRDLLKSTSKSFLGIEKMLELEETTLNYLEKEYVSLKNLPSEDFDQRFLRELLTEDEQDLVEQIQIQRVRAATTGKEFQKHPFVAISSVANEIMSESTPRATILLSALQNARQGVPVGDPMILTPRELSEFAKSAVVTRRKIRKQASPGKETNNPSEQSTGRAFEISNDSWNDMLSIIRTLVAYGCLKGDGIQNNEQSSYEDCTFTITTAGRNIGLLNFDNSLWCLVALGGTWDVIGASSKLDSFRSEMRQVFDEGDGCSTAEELSVADSSTLARQEANELVSLLRSLTAAELAGYVSCLVGEGSRAGEASVVDLFQKMSPIHQRVIQKSLLIMERLVEVQKQFDVDENTRSCALDIANCEVVTAWVNGCTWNEALGISGLSPGDLARTLSRVLDALRQIGNLPFTAIRKYDYYDTNTEDNMVLSGPVEPRGIHPDLRRMCREAAKAINRYPVKDPLSFDVNDSGEEADDDVDDESILDDSDVSDNLMQQ